jgi:hypothetical protein
MNLTTIIFSKNRAMQLGILLESCNLKSVVIYSYDEEFKSGYDKLRTIYLNQEFIEQVDFREDVIKNLGEYTMFLCDDDICINEFDEEVHEKFKIFKDYKDEILCLSLRLAPFMREAPVMNSDNEWEWKDRYRSWGYPMSVSSTIFRKKDILPIMIKEEFNNPVELEVLLRNNIPNKPYMICCDKPYFINNLANHVIPGKYRTSKLSLHYLEEMFLSGKKISLEKMKEKARKADYCFMVEKYEYQ